MSDRSEKTRRQILLGAAGAAAGSVGTYALYKAITRPPGPQSKAGGPTTSQAITTHLLTYREDPNRKIQLDMTAARGLTVDAHGKIIVAGDDRINLYGPDGKPAGSVSLDGQARCVAVGHGRVYVGLRDRVTVLADGKLTSWKTLGDKAVLTSLAVTEQSVFAADAGNRLVHKYMLDGNCVDRLGDDRFARGPHFIIPSPYFPVVAMPDGSLRIANTGRHAIEYWSNNGKRSNSWSGSGTTALDDFCGCCNPVSMAVLPDGSLVTAEKGIMRVKVYHPDHGVLLAVVAGPEQFEGRNTKGRKGVLSVATDTDGCVYILDPRMPEVRVFVPKESVDG